MDIDKPMNAIERAKMRGRSQSTNRRMDGVTNEDAATKAEKLAKLSQKKMNRMARQGEADRHQTGSLIKHLVSSSSQLSVVVSNLYTDCWKAWYWKDQQAIEAALLCCRCFAYHHGATGRKIMVGVQDASDTYAPVLCAGVVMQVHVSIRVLSTSICVAHSKQCNEWLYDSNTTIKARS
jgi:hypothetical protein